MKATVGASRKRRHNGYAMLLLLLVAAGLAVTGIVLMPSSTQPVEARQWINEEQNLATLAQEFARAVEIQQTIPATTNWAGFVARSTGQNTNSAQYVWPEFSSDTTAQRVLLINPALSSSLLPYVQNTNGLLNSQTNLAGTNGRALLISSTRRTLALPVTNGVTTSQSAFDNIWNWSYNPATKAPPSGWSSSWTSNAHHLHVQPINLANLFCTVSMSNVMYSVNNSSTSSIISLVNRQFLRGGVITALKKDGTLLGKRVINSKLEFFQAESCPWITVDIGSVSPAGSSSCGTTNLTLNGSGSGLGSSDEIHFCYQDSTGDTEIIARLSSLSAGGATTKEAGVILRANSLSSTADYLSSTYTQQRRVYLRYRYGGSVYSSYVSVGVDPPIWLRIRRVGDTFYAYYSTTGVSSWTTLLSATASGAPGFTKTGLLMTSTSDGTLATGIFDNISISQ